MAVAVAAVATGIEMKTEAETEMKREMKMSGFLIRFSVTSLPGGERRRGERREGDFKDNEGGWRIVGLTNDVDSHVINLFTRTMITNLG